VVLSGFDWLQPRGEVGQEGSFVGKSQAANLVAALPDLQDYLDHVVDVALGVNASRNCQAHQVHGGVWAEHKRPDFDRPDAAFQIERATECHAGEARGWDVRQEGAGVEVDGVAARRLHDGHALGGDVSAKVRRRSDTVLQVILLPSERVYRHTASRKSLRFEEGGWCG